MLVVFSGLPATGKTTISKAVAQKLHAVHIRVDTIEQSLKDAGVAVVGELGYRVAYKLAYDNLSLGLVVVADSVNPLAITRDAWRSVGRSTGNAVIDIELICSDTPEHRRRIESRVADIENQQLPSWSDVLNREYEQWSDERIVINTSGETPAQSISRTLSTIQQSRFY